MAQNKKKQPSLTLQQRAQAFVDHNYFFSFITTVILINAVTLGLETSKSISAQYGDILNILDEAALGIFVIEIALKLFAHRLSFFKKGWNLFDFIIVGVSLLPAIGPLAVLRALRVLRVLRLVSVVPEMRRVISALFSAIPGMASIMAVLMIIFYVSAVLATKLFGMHPDLIIAERFDSLGSSLFTLFQIMTLEGWSDEIVRPIMAVYPYAWLFFIPFIIITSFAVLNLFIGIIVDAINIIHAQEDEENAALIEDPVHKELKALRKDIAALKKSLKVK